ncbi:MAG TPA: cysteine desulfurase-like protein [Longimicrobiaceae bacterium]|jgi:cysteine desulfurase family protein (TIGR01976 family)|nr:cysteine desulfurase-like protein [Longimicrobiaceae bacterium]
MTSSEFASRVRTSFPVFERRVGGKPIAFFDGPGGSQVPRSVADAVAGYLTHHNANTHGAFLTSRESDAAILAAREAMADFVNSRADEIVFGANMTTLTFAFSRALGAEWGPGDEVIVTELDHQANVAPWRRMAEDRGVTVRAVPFDRETMTLDYAALEEMLSDRTRLVAIGAASNAVGTINDVSRVCSLARAAGALTYVDAVHYAPHRLVDVQAFGCDFLACSAYKFFGPHVGIVWAKREHLERFTPYKVPPASNDAPERWETGTLNHEGIAGTGAAVDFIASLDPAPAGDGRRAALARAMARIDEHEGALVRRLLDGLGVIGGVRIYGPPASSPRTPTVAFTVEGTPPDAVAAKLGDEGVFVWNGNFYAVTVCERLGLEDCGGLIRAGLAPYNTDEDVDRLIEGVARIARG